MQKGKDILQYKLLFVNDCGHDSSIFMDFKGFSLLLLLKKI